MLFIYKLQELLVRYYRTLPLLWLLWGRKVRLCLKIYVLTNMPLVEDMLRELESLYNYVNKSELIVSYNRPWLPHLLIYNIVK
jgi:hypothetical protein